MRRVTRISEVMTVDIGPSLGKQCRNGVGGSNTAVNVEIKKPLSAVQNQASESDGH